MDEVFATNRAELCGIVTAAPRYSHESRGIRFYTFPLQTRRLSGTADTVNIVLRESMLPDDGLLKVREEDGGISLISAAEVSLRNRWKEY